MKTLFISILLAGQLAFAQQVEEDIFLNVNLDGTWARSAAECGYTDISSYAPTYEQKQHLLDDLVRALFAERLLFDHTDDVVKFYINEAIEISAKLLENKFTFDYEFTDTDIDLSLNRRYYVTGKYDGTVIDDNSIAGTLTTITTVEDSAGNVTVNCPM